MRERDMDPNRGLKWGSRDLSQSRGLFLQHTASAHHTSYTLLTVYFLSTFIAHTHTFSRIAHNTRHPFLCQAPFFVLVILKCSMDLIERVALEMVTSVQIKQINFHNQFLEKNNERD